MGLGRVGAVTGTGGRIVSWVLVALGIVASWTVVVTMTVPRAITGAVGDYGFFTGVADRLRAGDVLYEQVWDNKDPFVFYSIALARNFGVGGAWALEVLWVVLACLGAYLIARQVGLSRLLSAFVAWVLAPLVVLGMPYFMGSTHLPGVALVLLAVALALGVRWAWAGVPVGVLVFFKFVMLPLALAVVVTVALASRRSRGLWRFALGFVATVGVVAVVMLVRGELVGFLRTQVDNILYSQSPIVSAAYTSLFQKVAQHVVILVNPHIVAVLLATFTGLVVAAIAHRRGAAHRPSGVRGWLAQSTLWWVTAVAFVVAVATIAITGKWFHHAEILAVSSVLVLVLVAHTLRVVWARPGWLAALVAAVLAVPLTALPDVDHYASAVRSVGSTWQDANATDPLTALMAQRAPTTVAFVGQGNLVPRSGGLDGWQVVCRNIAQRPFNPQWMFDETVACLPAAELVVVTNDYGPDPVFPAYNAFIDSVEAVLASQYDCEQVPDFRLCTRRD